MKKIIFAIIILGSLFQAHSQDVLLEKEIKLRSDFLSSKKRLSLPIVNSKTNEVGMFLLDRKEIVGYFFDENYGIKDSIVTSRPKKKYSSLLGATYNEDTYHMLFTNDKKNKFLASNINLQTRETTTNEFEIESNKENFLDAINIDNRLFILTIRRGTSKMTLFEFERDQLVKRQDVDLSDHKFSRARKSLNYILTHTTSAVRDNIVLSKVDNQNPNSIDVASYPNKIYAFNNSIYLTLDVYDDFSKVISIDLKSYEYEVKDYQMKEVDCDHDLGVKSNSYLLKDYIFQVSGCENEIYFSISNLESTVKMKEWNVKKDEEIKFSINSIKNQGK